MPIGRVNISFDSVTKNEFLKESFLIKPDNILINPKLHQIDPSSEEASRLGKIGLIAKLNLKNKEIKATEQFYEEMKRSHSAKHMEVKLLDGSKIRCENKTFKFEIMSNKEARELSNAIDQLLQAREEAKKKLEREKLNLKNKSNEFEESQEKLDPSRELVIEDYLVEVNVLVSTKLLYRKIHEIITEVLDKIDRSVMKKDKKFSLLKEDNKNAEKKFNKLQNKLKIKSEKY